MKSLFKRLLPEQRIRQPTPRAHSITIRCHYCGTQAPALLLPDGDELPNGWVGADVWFRRVYSCPECNTKLMSKIEDLLNMRR